MKPMITISNPTCISTGLPGAKPASEVGGRASTVHGAACIMQDLPLLLHAAAAARTQRCLRVRVSTEVSILLYY